MINLFIVCKNNLFYSNLSPILLCHNISISTICTSPEEAVDRYMHLKPDIVLMDFNWSRRDFSGTQLISSFLKRDPHSKVIFATSHYEQRVCLFSKEIGAAGYLYRNVEKISAIVDCIWSVHTGRPAYLREEGADQWLTLGKIDDQSQHRAHSSR